METVFTFKQCPKQAYDCKSLPLKTGSYSERPTILTKICLSTPNYVVRTGGDFNETCQMVL